MLDSDKEETEARFGDYKGKVNFHKYEHLKEVEDFFKSEMKKHSTNFCFDLEASERPYFDNLNYTNYGDFFVLHPLQPDLSHIQTREALIYGSDDFEVNYFEEYSNRVLYEDINKYKTTGRLDVPTEAVVCLIGQNKNRVMCYNKLRHIYQEHGKFATYKPHPLTDQGFIDSYKKNINKNITLADKDHDVYAYIKCSEVVYTTHSSETAFHSLCLGKRIEPIDTFQSRFFGSFSHINTHLFEAGKNSEYVINKLFNDYRSGIIHPLYQSDWKERVSKYLEYIHEKRRWYRFKYV